MSGGAAAGRLGWPGVVRLGLVQTALGALVILTTSTLNRVMVVELGLAAVLPGALVGWHYAVQLSRPRWGYGADVHGGRSPWIVGGMAVLALGAVGAAAATALMESSLALGVACAVVAFLLIGAGVGASGTNLLALLAIRTEPGQKAAAAAVLWIMMIAGFVVTAGVAGALLDPFSLARLVAVTAGVAGIAVVVTGLAVWGIEGRASASSPGADEDPAPRAPFSRALAEVWREDEARRFTVFVFVSMLAYSAQDLILEPFAGLVHGYTPGESTQLAGIQNGGVLLGMVTTALVASRWGSSRVRFLRLWTVGGCAASAVALGALAVGATQGPTWPLSASVFGLGVANGAFAVAAIGSMMSLASAGRQGREGTRMGLWGAAQAIAFGLGGFLGAAGLDLARAVFSHPGAAFAVVFAVEAALFLVAAWLAGRVEPAEGAKEGLPRLPAGEPLSAG